MHATHFYILRRLYILIRLKQNLNDTRPRVTVAQYFLEGGFKFSEASTSDSSSTEHDAGGVEESRLSPVRVVDKGHWKAGCRHLGEGRGVECVEGRQRR